MIKTIFAAIGFSVSICAACMIIMFLFYWIEEFIQNKRYKYYRKHRFDKPPTAKCYCVDCKHWRKEDGRCFYFNGRNTADCWFCWNAEPLEYNEYCKAADSEKQNE